MAEYCISRSLTGFDSIKNILKLTRYKRKIYQTAWCPFTSQSCKWNLCITMRPSVLLKFTCLCLRFPSLYYSIYSCISNPVPIVSNMCLACGIDTYKMTCDFHACKDLNMRCERRNNNATTMQKKDKNWWPFAEFKMHFLNTLAPMEITSCFAMIPKSLSYFDVTV